MWHSEPLTVARCQNRNRREPILSDKRTEEDAQTQSNHRHHGRQKVAGAQDDHRCLPNLQKTGLLEGISRTYKPKDDEGEQLPPEKKLVQLKSKMPSAASWAP